MPFRVTAENRPYMFFHEVDPFSGKVINSSLYSKNRKVYLFGPYPQKPPVHRKKGFLDIHALRVTIEQGRIMIQGSILYDIKTWKKHTKRIREEELGMIFLASY